MYNPARGFRNNKNRETLDGCSLCRVHARWRWRNIKNLKNIDLRSHLFGTPCVWRPAHMHLSHPPRHGSACIYIFRPILPLFPRKNIKAAFAFKGIDRDGPSITRLNKCIRNNRTLRPNDIDSSRVYKVQRRMNDKTRAVLMSGNKAIYRLRRPITNTMIFKCAVLDFAFGWYSRANTYGNENHRGEGDAFS